MRNAASAIPRYGTFVRPAAPRPQSAQPGPPKPGSRVPPEYGEFVGVGQKPASRPDGQSPSLEALRPSQPDTPTRKVTDYNPIKRTGPRPAGPRPAVVPLAAKLILMITLILLVSLGLIISLVWYMIYTDTEQTTLVNNKTINSRAAAAAEETLEAIRSNVAVLLHSRDAPGFSQDVDFFFSQNEDAGAIVSLDLKADSLFVNDDFFDSREIDSRAIVPFLSDKEGEYRRRKDTAVRGEAGKTGVVILNASPFFDGVPMLAMFFSPPDGGDWAALFSSEKLTSAFGRGANSSVMINDSGDILVHPDNDMVRLPAKYRENPARGDIVNKTRIGIGDVTVITTVRREVVFEGITTTTRRNIFLGLGAWFLGVFALYFLSKSLSNSIEELREAAEQIEQGDYRIALKNRSGDETEVLADSLVSMSHVLENFEKLTNKTVARLAQQGRLATGGEDRNASFIFTDIRSFTSISEKMRPEEVVDFLNDYMDRMVACVTVTGGVIDKFIGDAVMAHWGAVEATGTPEQNALASVRTALLMRGALGSYNAGRGGDKNPVLKIGCGLNSGTVIAGQIGSQERLEYTVIGDAVSLADLTESYNKSFGTEILITENTARLAGRHLILEEMPAITVENKKVRMYAVVNMREGPECDKLMAEMRKIPKIDMDIAGRLVGLQGPKTLGEVRALLGIEKPDLDAVNLNAREKKYGLSGDDG